MEIITNNEIFELELPEDFYLTSDTWFGRPNIINIGNRISFSTVEEMNSQLIKNWNKKVRKNDTIIHLGNFAWDADTARYALEKLNGKIYFILGNADHAIDEVAEEFDNVIIIENEILHLSNFNIVLSHYPLEVWNGKEAGVIHAHGHTIFSHKTDLRIQKRFNVCTDHWEYTPIKLSLINDIINLSKHD
jgi:calcineurin-like phosphoesterase family protein